MIPTPLLALEIQLHQAVEAQQFGEAGRLFSEYCRSADDHIRSLAPGSPLRARIAARAQQVLEWLDPALQAARDAIAEKLTPLPLVSRYLPANIHRARMHIEA